MRLALNYSPPARDLVAVGVLDVDLWKCPAWPDLAEEAAATRPAYVHFPYQAGAPDPADAPALHAARALLKATETPFVSIHVNPRPDPGVSPARQTDDLLHRCCRDVRALCDAFGAARVVAENVPCWRDRPHPLSVAAQPAFLREIVEETGCGLLLDVAHARLAAGALDLPTYAYLDALPLGRLAELHVSGVQADDAGWRRDHMPMTGEDEDLLTYVLRGSAEGRWPVPALLALEYGGVGESFAWRSEDAMLRRDVRRVCAVVRSCGLLSPMAASTV